ncbi:hypothetical protein H4W32_007516 [Actinophytocola algeriensis]|uniref:Uncharacterized protein n=1 Tax=Actinophytocola algeriensis TaxID=1768010 RepID=A0A7W7Q657_9PSEU|nr:hypothetical protein [Actinophytocola algeriensis]MBE1479474.1 hypothetical protein [Actinophytocola algeriensis]
MIFHRVQRCGQLRSGADPDVVTNGDRGIVHEDGVVVDEAVGADG